MGDTFGQAAMRASSAAVALLGWRPDEFWRSTPAELSSALEPTGAEMQGPGTDIIAELRRRFPDD